MFFMLFGRKEDCRDRLDAQAPTGLHWERLSEEAVEDFVTRIIAAKTAGVKNLVIGGFRYWPKADTNVQSPDVHCREIGGHGRCWPDDGEWVNL
jgi:hypothetical protein